MAFQSKGLIGYNSVSISQLKVAQQFIPELVEALKSVDNESKTYLSIADYGCSEGMNSITTFTEAFLQFRQVSSTPIFITHTDLPENNWSAVNKAAGDPEKSYVSLGDIFFSTLGRSFYNQIFPESSIDIGYSSFAMHYLSKRCQRGPGEYGWIFPNARRQGFQDFTHLLSLRIKELKPNGTFLIILTGREQLDLDPTFSMFLCGSVKRLLEKNIITEKEFSQYVWHSYPYHIDELKEIFEGFQGKIVLERCEYGKRLLPYYEEYLMTGDKEKYIEDILRMMRIMMRHPLFGCLEREEQDKERVLELVLNEIKEGIQQEVKEIYQDYNIVLFRKLE